MKALIMLDEFLLAAQEDHRMHPTHISLYLALLQLSKQCHFKGPINEKRGEIMRRAKITGRSTYQRCLRDLHDGGYILYQPSFNRYKNARIYLKGIEQ